MIYRLTWKVDDEVPTIINMTLMELFEEFPELINFSGLISSAEFKQFTKLEFQNAKYSWCLEVVDEN